MPIIRARLLHSLALAVGAGLAGLAACATPDATAPASAPLAAVTAVGAAQASANASVPAEPGVQGTLVACARRAEQSASAVIGPEGGVLRVGGDALVVPPGALDAPTLISATIPAGDVSAIRFEPHGLQFRVPAGLVLNAAGCSIPAATVPFVVYMSDEGAMLEHLDAVYDSQGRRVAAPIQHFSQYAIAL